MSISQSNDTKLGGKGQGSRPEPHPRDGHLRIPNEVAEALARLRVSGSQAQILWAVLRKTLGWQHSGEWRNEPYPISVTDLNQSTGVSRRQILRELEDLTRRHILSSQPRKGKAPLLSLNLDVNSWGVTKLSLVTEPSPVCDRNVTSLVTELSLVPALNQMGLNKPKQTLKKTGAPQTDELELLDILKGLEGWRYGETDDLTWLRELRGDFPDFDLEQLKLARDYYSDRPPPPKHKGVWKKRLRNWMRIKRGFERKEHSGPRGKSFEQYMREQEGS